MAPAVRSSAGVDSTSGGCTVSVPSGVVNGDFLLAAIEYAFNGAITPPAGWTLIRTDSSPTPSVRLSSYYRIASSEPASYTWAVTNNAANAGAITAFTGVDAVSPVNVSGGQSVSSSTSIGAPSVTSTVDGCLIVALHAQNNSFGAWTDPAGYTRQERRLSAAGTGANVDLLVTYKSQTSAGATGTVTATNANTGEGAGQLVVLRPAPTAVGDTIQAIWSVRATAFDTLNPLWSVRALATDTLTSQWAVRTCTYDTLGSVWVVRKLASDVLVLLWNVNQPPPSKTLEAVWVVRRVAADSVEFDWSIRQLAGDSTIAIWNVQKLAADTAGLVWAVRKVVGDESPLLWNVRENSIGTLRVGVQLSNGTDVRVELT